VQKLKSLELVNYLISSLKKVEKINPFRKQNFNLQRKQTSASSHVKKVVIFTPLPGARTIKQPGTFPPNLNWQTDGTDGSVGHRSPLWRGDDQANGET
jgi:hypothetical protein